MKADAGHERSGTRFMIAIRGKRALVTGAASGIGRCIALALAREGANLFLTDRDEAGLASVARQAAAKGVVVESAVCDLADPQAVTAMLSRVTGAGTPLHILVNCAAIAPYVPLHRMRPDEVRQVMAVNLLAPMQITTELLDALLRAEEAHIVNVSSFLGLVPFKRLVAYQTSKFGLSGFTHSLRIDYHRKNFGVTLLCPGFVRTPMIENPIDLDTKRPPSLLPAWLCTTPEKVADKAIAAIKKNKGVVVVTPLARFAWWVMRLSPGLYDWLIREGWRERGRIFPPSGGER